MLNIPYIKPILIGVLLAAWAGSMWYAREDGKEAVQTLWNEEKLLVSKAQLADVADKREKDAERILLAEKVAKDAQDKIATMVPKLARYDDVSRRLRIAESTLSAALEGRSDTTAGVGGLPADSPAFVYPILRGGLDQAERETLKFADESRIAGEACIRQYNEIRATQATK